MTDMNGPDGITAVLLQLAGLGQQLAALDERQAQRRGPDPGPDHRAGRDRGRPEGHRRRARRGARRPGRAGPPRRRPGRPAAATPRAGTRRRPRRGGGSPDDPGRGEAIARLRSWVERVYRPGYGHLAAGLGECWEQHPLCLYILDWLSELWSVLYLAPARTQATLAGQAEWHTRLLTAAAEQLARETRALPARHRRLAGPRPDGPRP